MRVTDFIDPRTELNTWNNFKELSTKQKAITLLVSAIAAVIFLGYGGFVAFRALTHYFSKVETHDSKASKAATPLLSEEDPIPEVLPVVNRDISTMVDWKQVLYRGLQKGLIEIDRTHGFAEESGDCFFDSVAQVLNKVDGRGTHTKQSVRLRLEQQLLECPDNRYEEMLRENIDGYTYRDFCENIRKCVEDYRDGGAPIWGNKTCLQLVADVYQVKIEVHSTMAFELSLMESLDEQWNDFEKYQYNRGENEIVVEVPTIVDTSEFNPREGRTRATVELGNMARGPWGHFVPVFPRR